MSVAAGIDFGDYRRIGLQKPNAMESLIIAKVRHYHSVVKIQTNTTKAGRTDFTNSKTRTNHILFRHDAPVLASLNILLHNFYGKEPR